MGLVLVEPCAWHVHWLVVMVRPLPGALILVRPARETRWTCDPDH
jgi:hypothetical protein